MSDPKVQATESTWLQLATSRPVVGRALVIALIVGTMLCAINHGDCLVSGHFTWMCLGKSLVTAVVPYVVSVVSSVDALRAGACREEND